MYVGVIELISGILIGLSTRLS